MTESKVRGRELGQYELIHKHVADFLTKEEITLGALKYEEFNNADKADHFVFNESLEFMLAHLPQESFNVNLYELDSKESFFLFYVFH